MKYPPALKFELLDDRTGKTVFEGNTKLSKAASDKDEDAYTKELLRRGCLRDGFFAVDSKPGVYRVYVSGVGCSYPFEIKEKAWQEAFFASARGFYHQRSGIALGPPYTSFVARDVSRPTTDSIVWHSTCPLMDSGNGINALGTDNGQFRKPGEGEDGSEGLGCLGRIHGRGRLGSPDPTPGRHTLSD